MYYSTLLVRRTDKTDPTDPSTSTAPHRLPNTVASHLRCVRWVRLVRFLLFPLFLLPPHPTFTPYPSPGYQSRMNEKLLDHYYWTRALNIQNGRNLQIQGEPIQ
jgi:hypothetical protein